MLARVLQYLKEGETIKPDWTKFIVNKKIPLDERWEVFLAAPSEWSIDQNSGDIPIKCLSQIFDSPYDDFHMDRGSAMDMTELFEYLDQKLADGDPEKLTQKLIDKAKEEVMQANLGSWEYDW